MRAVVNAVPMPNRRWPGVYALIAMTSLQKARVLMWAGGVIAVAGFAWHLSTGGKPRSPVYGFVLLGMMGAAFALALIGAHFRRQVQFRKLEERNFSFCAGCGYPFDPRADDTTVVTCSECGANCRAELFRQWYRENPERLRE